MPSVKVDLRQEHREFLQLDRKKLAAPAGLLGQPVVGQHVGPNGGLAQVRNARGPAPSASREAAPLQAGRDRQSCGAADQSMIGLMKPNSWIESAICWICFFECVRAFRCEEQLRGPDPLDLIRPRAAFWLAARSVFPQGWAPIIGARLISTSKKKARSVSLNGKWLNGG